MSTTTTSGRITARPGTLVAAVALIVIGVLANFVVMPLVPEDERATVIVVGSALSLLWLASAVGLWQGQRWAFYLALAVTAISGLLAAPGIPFAEETSGRVLSVMGLVHAIAVCWLLLTRSTRDALR